MAALVFLLVPQGLVLAQTIAGFSPGSAAPGAVVTITGTNLTGATGVSFNGVPTTGLTVLSSTTLTAYVPVGATTGPLVVAKTSSSGTSAASLTVLPIPPAVQVSVSPGGPLSACASPVLTAAASLKPFLPGGTGTSGPAFAAVLQPDGKVIIGGYFSRFNTSTRGGIVRLNADGTLDTSFAPTGTGFDYDVRALALQPDGKVLVGGYITGYNGTPVAHLARLNANGTLDATFVQSGTGFDGFIYALAVQPDGKILVGGHFTNYNSNLRVSLARLNADGTLDTSFVLPGSGIVGTVRAIIVQPDGRSLIGGYLETVNNVARGSIIRLNTDGSLDPAFASTNGVAYSTVLSMVRQPDGKVVAGGGFASPSGAALSIGRLNANGTRDFSFAPTGFGLSNSADALALQPDGRIMVTGAFTSYNGIVRNHLARLNTDGTLDTSFATAGAGPGTGDGDLVLQPDGKAIIAGGFSSFGTVATARNVRINADGTLETTASAAPGATYVWAPGGSTGATVAAAMGGSYQATATVSGYSFLSNAVTVTGCAPTISSFSPGSGPVGTILTINGTNLTGTSLIAFAGTTGTTVSTGFTVNAAGTQLTGVVVPAGAQTGPLTVTTPGGTATSTGSFTVTMPSSALLITGVSPVANARAAARTAPVTITFDQAVTTGSAAALKVYAAQRGGLRTRGTTPAVASGNTVSFAPGATAFLPGETVFSTVTTAAQSSAGGTLAQPSVQQFTAAVGGTGRGVFTRASTLAVPNAPNGIAAGDVDGDGDVDLVTANTSASTLTVLLNNGSAAYAIASTVALPQRPFTVALGDVDGDGDLDVVAAVFGPGGTTVSTRLNGGNATGSNTGTFSNGSDLVVGDNPTFLALGDVDGDGDLDVVVAVNGTTGNGTSVRIGLNGGDATGSNTGIFGNGSTVVVGTGPFALALGDVDNDHDLDLVTSVAGGLKVSLNAGNGTFGGGSTVALPTTAVAQSVALADVNADGYLDVLTEISVRLNTANGSGTFGGGSDPLLGTAAVYTIAADVDADGDLDLIAAIAGSGNPSMSVRLNNGAGTFGGGSDLAWGQQLFYLVAADLDGDGDLDIAAAAPKDAPAMSILLNGPAPTLTPTITSFTPTSGPAGTTVTINGTNLGGTSVIAFGGPGNNAVTAGYTVNAAGTQITGVIVPGGAQTGAISVTTPAGTATSATLFTVPVPILASISPTSGPVGTSVTLTGTYLGGATLVSFNGTTTSTFSSSSATQVVLVVPGGATTGPVTVTTPAGTSNAVTFTVTCPVATIAYGAASYCQTASINPAPALTGPTGGSFAAATGLTLNSATGLITLASSTPGTYTISYTAGTASCPTTATAQVIITAAPSAAFAYGAPAYCPVDGTTITPTLGTNATAGTFSAVPVGLALNASTGAIGLAGSLPGTYTITNTVAAGNGCAATSATTQVVVNALPVAAIAASGPTTFCQGGSVTLTAGGGGSYLWSTGATTASITVSASGTYGVTVTSAAGCTATANTAVTVNPVPSAPFTYGGTTFCASGANPTPAITGTVGGTFSAAAGLALNAATGTISLAGSVPGTYTVTYALAGSCPAAATASVTITAAPVGLFSYAGSPYCGTAANAAPTLPAGSTAGVFSSTAGLAIAAATGIIDLTASLPGTYTVTNTVAAVGGCAAATATATVTITAAPVAVLTTTTPTTFCQGGAVVLAASGGPGNTYQFLLNGSAIVGATSAAYTAITSGAYSVVVTTAGGCAATSTPTTVTVNPATTATFAYGGTTFCASDTNPTPAITGTAGGTFSAAPGLALNAATGTINLAASAPGTYSVIYSVGGTCPSSASAAVTITAPATATFSYAGTSYCVSGVNPAPVVPATSTAGTFTSTPGLSINSATGVISLAASAPGTYIVTNTVAGSCGSSAMATVTITAAPVAAFSYAGTGYCEGSAGTATPALGPGATAGTFTAAPGLTLNATTGVVTVAASIPGSYTVTNTVAAAGGCAATMATAAITIAPRPATPAVTVSYPAATGTALLTSSAAPAGTTYQWYLGTTSIAGATGPSYTANGNTAPGAYTVRFVATATGCQSAPSTNVTVTATKNAIAGTQLNMYPNPTPNGQLTLELTGFRSATQLTVLDALGRVVFSQLLPANAGTATRTLDLTGVATGVYLLRLSNADGVLTHRLVRE